MRKASVEEREMIAHAWIVTRTGAFIAIFVSYCTLLLITVIKPETTIQSFIVAETSAKLAMVTCAWQGSSPQKGLGSIFIDSIGRKAGEVKKVSFPKNHNGLIIFHGLKASWMKAVRK
jgi:hypothetical protein